MITICALVMKVIQSTNVKRVELIKAKKLFNVYTLFISTEVMFPIRPKIEIHPVDTIGELYQSVSLTCTASGNPIPNIIWYKDNISIPITNSNTSVLLFPELNLDDRGFYHCKAESIINGENISKKSHTVVLNIKG